MTELETTRRTHAAQAIPRRRRRVLGRELRDNAPLYLLALPGVLFFLVFSYVPMFGIVMAFKDFDIVKGILGSAWVGFDNFKFFFTSGAASRVLTNTLYLNVLFIAFTTAAALALAISLNEIRLHAFKRVAQSVIFLPYFMSWVVVSMMLQAFLSGVSGQESYVNGLLAAVGLPGVDWFLEPGVWPWLLTFLRVWQGAGYLSIIYLAAITGIPDDVYEAARIDGASSRQLAWKITLPLLVPTIVIMTLLAVGRIFYGDFGLIYAIVGDNGVLLPTTEVIDTYVYRALRQFGDLGMAAAVGLFQSVAGLVLLLAANAWARRYSAESALF